MYYEFALPVGAILKSPVLSYEIVETLGYGSFGITYKVSSTIMVNNVPITTFFAVKEYFMKGCYRDTDGCTVISAPSIKKDVEMSRKDFIIEAQRLNHLSGKSQNIVKVNEVFEYFGTAYYVMQYLDGGEMTEHLERYGAMSEAQSLAIIRPIAEAVKLIHKERLLHLDIKPGNIVLMTDPKAKHPYPVLIDFGIAKHFSSTGAPTSSMSAKGASNGYAPQEQYSDVDHFAPEIDVYALGATLLHFLSGEQPKNAFDITPEDINAMIPDAVSKRTRRAILAAMQAKKTDRTQTVDAFLASLEETYTLPPGFLLNGQMAKYRIIGIHSETDSYIVYDAVADEEEMGNQIEDSEETTVVGGENSGNSRIEDDANPTVSMESQSVIEDDDNPTVSLEAMQSGTPAPAPAPKTGAKKPAAVPQQPQQPVKEKPMSSSVKYLVYECFSKTLYKRYDDGSVTGYNSSVHYEFEKAKTGIPNGFLGNRASNGLPLAECFGTNGTIYFTYMVVTKQPTRKPSRKKKSEPKGEKGPSWFSRHLKHILITLGALVLLAGLAFGGIYLYKYLTKDKPVSSETSNPKEDADSLKADGQEAKDSVKATGLNMLDSLNSAFEQLDSLTKELDELTGSDNTKTKTEPAPTSSSNSQRRDKPQDNTVKPKPTQERPQTRPQTNQTTRPQTGRPTTRPSQQTTTRPSQTTSTRPSQTTTTRPSQTTSTRPSGQATRPTGRPTTRPSQSSSNSQLDRNVRTATGFDD